MNNSLVSIIIPVYNTAEYLEECIESVLNQTYKNIELILVNDGSTDNSGEICKNYADKYPIKYIFQTNQGVSVARNNGLDAATGKYVYFLDSDDMIDSKFIETSVDVAEKENADVVITAINVDNKGKFGIIWTGAPWQLFIRRAIIDKYTLRFVVGMRTGEDNLFDNMVTLVTDKVQVNEYAIYYYRLRSDQTTQVVDSEIIFNDLQVKLIELEKFCYKYNLFEIKLKVITEIIFVHYLNACMNSRLSVKAKEKLFNMVKYFIVKHNLPAYKILYDSVVILHLNICQILSRVLILHCKTFKDFKKYLFFVNIYKKLKTMFRMSFKIKKINEAKFLSD